MILILVCDIFDQVCTLLKYWENVNFDFTINLNFAFTFLNFYFIQNKINAILLHTCHFLFVKNFKMI